MPSPVNSRPSPVRLAARQVGVAVSAAHGRRLAQELNFQRAYAVQSIASHVLARPVVPADPQDVWFLYRRTPGVEIVRVAVQLRPQAGAAGGTLAIDYGTDPASLTSAASLFVGPSAAFDGVRIANPPTTRLRTQEEHVGFLDVRTFDPDDLYCVRVRVEGAIGTASPLSVAAHEVMLASVDPVAEPTGPGVNESEFDFRNRVYGGVVASAGGLQRLWGEIDSARTKSRRHLQLGTNSAAPIERDDVAAGAFDWPYGDPLDTFDPVLLARSRRLRKPTGSTFNTYTFAVIYSYDPTHAGLTDSKITMHVDTSTTGGATTASYVLQLTDTGGALALGTVGATIPWDGSGAYCEINFTAQTANDNGGPPVSDPVYVYALALIEEEA